MLQDKFIGIIETHAEQLTSSWIYEVKHNPLTQGYQNLPDKELHRLVYDIYKRLGTWLPQDELSFRQTAEHYMKLGRARARAGFKISEVIYSFSLSRVELWKYIRNQGIINDSIDMYRALEFSQKINLFYDKVIYFVSSGFESAHLEESEVFSKSGFFDKIVDSFAHWFMKDLK